MLHRIIVQFAYWFSLQFTKQRHHEVGSSTSYLFLNVIGIGPVEVDIRQEGPFGPASAWKCAEHRVGQ